MNAFIALMRDRRVSIASKLLFCLAVGVYAVLPVDLIPDLFLPLGIIDDGGMILAAATLFKRHARGQIEMAEIKSNSKEKSLVAAEAEDSSLVQSTDESGAASERQRSVHIHRGVRASRTDWGCMGLIALLFFSPFIGIAILLLSGSMALSGILSPIIDFFDAPTTVNVVSSRTIVQSLQRLGQLVTARMEVAKTDIRVSIHEGILDSGYYSANHIAFGSLEAGVDITGFGSEVLLYDHENNSITLTLPQPIITSCNIEHIDQYEYSVTLFQKDWDTVRQLAQYDAIIAFRQDVLEGGILDRAKEEITERMGNFVSELTGSQTRIIFAEERTEPVFGPACQPEIPSGWQKTDDGAWKKEG